MNGDPVNHPSHYGGEGNPYECIEVIEAWDLGFNLGNAVKYIARAGKKPDVDARTDLQKARFYVNREIERLSHDLDMPRLLGDLEAARAREGRLIGALRAVEWGGSIGRFDGPRHACCPECGAYRGTTHEPDCVLATALAETEARGE